MVKFQEQKWKSLSDLEKSPSEDMAEANKKRYEARKSAVMIRSSPIPHRRLQGTREGSESGCLDELKMYDTSAV
jgi:hypothetical protein